MANFFANYPGSFPGGANASVGLNGATAPTSSTEVGGINPGGNLNPLHLDASNNLLVNVTTSVLPTGAATAANQVIEIADLAQIVTNTTGLALETTLSAMSAKLPATLGAHVIAASLAVNIASDQIVPISASVLPLPTGAATAANQATEIASLASIDTKLTSPLSVAQSGSWTTGRTWVLSSGTDSVSASISNFPATVAVTQSTSPWVVSGTVTANQGGTWNINNISGTVSLPTGAATSANQTTANASLALLALESTQLTGNVSLASIDSKLTAPLATKAPVNTTGSGSAAAATVSTVATLTAPANAVGFVLMNLDVSTTNMRWAVGRTASATLGQQLQPGRDSGFVPVGANISIIAESGTCTYDVQWVSQ